MRYLRIIAWGLLLLAGSANLCLSEEAVTRPNVNVQEFYLENGMQFLIVERHTTPQVACRLAIRAGSALEEAGKTGIAHMLEHIMFKGTKNFGTLNYREDELLQKQIEAAYQTILTEQQKRNPDQALIREKYSEMEALRLKVQKIFVPKAFSSQVGKNGAVGVNAFTSKDQTQYTMSVPSDMIEQWFSIVSEQLFEPSWREFYVEKEVIQREWAFRYINNPSGAAWLDLDAIAYTAHPYRNPVIGWKTDMERFSTQSAIEFHTQYYNPTNAVCVLVGDVTVEEAKRLAKIYFLRYPPGRRSTETVTREPEQQGPRKSIRFLKGARTPLVRIGFHAARMGSDDFYALDAMTMILSHGRGARMPQNIVNSGLAVGAWTYNPDNRYGGMVVVGGSPNEPDALKQKDVSEKDRRQAYLKACEGLENILLAEIDRLKTEPVSQRELERIKKLNQRDFLDRMRSNEALAGTLATLEVQAGWRYFTTYLDKIAAVTVEDIQNVANKYIRNDKKTSVYVIPGDKPDRPPENYSEIRSLSGSEADKIVKPVSFENHSFYLKPLGWKHPLSFDRKPEKMNYPSPDLTIVDAVPLFYMPDIELPFIDMTILVKAGAVDLDSDKMGLTDLLGHMLIRGGTESYTPAQLAAVLDENAVRVSVSIGAEAAVIHLSVMKGDWETGLKLLGEILTRPRFDPEIFKVVKVQAMTALKRQGEDAHAVSMREAAIWRFKGHPYGRDPLIGLKTIPSISTRDLKGFLDRHFVPANMVVSIAGDINKGKAVDDLRKLLQILPHSTPPQRHLAAPAERPPVVALIHKPGQVQAQVTMALRSVKRTHPDFWNISLLMQVFGGDNSMIYRRLRDDLGLVYAAYFYQTYYWEAGMLTGYIGCKGGKTRDAILETVKIMETLHRNVPSKLLAQKRLDALNSFVFNVDTPAELVEVYSRYYLRKEPLDTLSRIQDAYMAASRENLKRLAKEYLNPNKIIIFIVADKTIPVKRDGVERTLEADLKDLAENLGLPFREIELR